MGEFQITLKNELWLIKKNYLYHTYVHKKTFYNTVKNPLIFKNYVHQVDVLLSKGINGKCTPEDEYSWNYF